MPFFSKNEKTFTIKGDDCSFCLKSDPEHPQACIYCLSVVGCRPCVEKWAEFKRKRDFLPTCPRCRKWWAVSAGVVDVANAEEDEEEEEDQDGEEVKIVHF